MIYPGYTGGELAKELLHYGISSITLQGCGSKRAGLRMCVSQIGMDKIKILQKRIDKFKQDHPQT